MSRRLRDIVAPVRPPVGDRGYRRVLRWAALPVTNRRWAAPLCAAALGFGLFVGVAIGPGTSGSLATGAGSVIEIPSLLSAGGESETASGGLVEAGAGAGSAGSEASSFPTESSATEFVPSYTEAESPASYETSEPAPPAKQPAPEKETEPGEEAQQLSGVVVHVNPAAGSYTVAEAGGLLTAVHAAKLPVPGAAVSVPVRMLANGTAAEAGPRKQRGTKAQADLEGIVTFVDPDSAAPAYAVSKRGVSVLVHIHPDPAGAPAVLPQLGAYAVVAVDVEKAPPASELPVAPPAEAIPPAEPTPPACAPDPALPAVVPPAPVGILWQRQLDADGAPFASSDFAGVVMATCPSEGLLRLSADDLRESGSDLVFTVPAAIDTGQLKPGDSVTATAAIAADGTLSLTGLAGDERTKGADDATTAQGDLVSHQPK